MIVPKYFHQTFPSPTGEHDMAVMPQGLPDLLIHIHPPPPPFLF